MSPTESSPLLRQASRSDSSKNKRPQFHHQYENVKTGPEVLVDFEDDDDPYNPQNWPTGKKCLTTFLYGLTTFGSAWSSAIYSAGQDEIAQEFNVSTIVASLGTMLLLFGFGVGPLLWSPMSELYGRKMAVLPAYFVGIAFTLGTAAAKDIQTVLITRFFTGLFASAPVTCAGGALADFWDPIMRGTALQFYALTVLGGPMLSPIAGGAIIYLGFGWRWIEWVTAILMALILVLDIVFIDESFAPCVLVEKARRLRFESGNWSLHAKHEEWEASFASLAQSFLLTPFKLIATPIMASVALYASFVYGLLYLTLGSFPVIFAEVRGWNTLISKLPFVSLFLGIILGVAINTHNNHTYYKRKFYANDKQPAPEARLPPMMFGSIVFCAGLFILGWTSSPRYHWILPCLGGFCIGTGFVTIFQGSLNYLIDAFQSVSASAVAAQTFMRSILAGVFPVISAPLFQTLGPEWASSLLGFVALAMIPIPFIFFYYGATIRSKGKYTGG